MEIKEPRKGPWT